jgi:N-acetylglucosaminyl-diphospho-decaprenol L-rhamnosyltransferase
VIATVIVPSWNGAQRLQRLLPSLGADSEVIVVDNGSTDGTADLLARRFPHVESLRLERNHGFSNAVNRAAAVASSDAIVLVNDDCVCEQGFAERLAGALDPARGVPMAAGVLLEAHDPTVIDSAGVELDNTLLVFDYLNGQPVEVLDRPVADPLGPSGSAAAFDRSAFIDCGGFDERLFAYWEDVDLILRLRVAGGRCVLVPNARAIHSHSATLGAGSARKDYLTGFGRGYVLRKWGVLAGGRGAVALAREAGICAAQVAVDRTPAGIRGRMAGWHAASETQPHPFPAAAVGSSRRSIAREFRRRASRRRRLRRGTTTA